MPERHAPGLARRGRDDDTVGGDVLDPPCARAQQERLARTALVDHLLVELTHAGAVGQEHAEQPAIGDGAAARDREPLRTGAAAQGAADPIPDDARSQLAELVGWIAAGQQIEHVVQHVVRQLAVVRGAAHDAGHVVDRPLVERGHGHDLLREHIERIAGIARVLDQAELHSFGDDRRFDEVGAVLGEDLAAARLADLMAGPTDALQTRRHRARRFDLHHEVDRAHVDAELERAGGDQPLQTAGLELVFDLQPSLAGQRTVVGLDQLGRRRGAHGLGGAVLAVERELVQAGGQPFGQTAGIDEHDGGAVLLDEFEQSGVHRRPDRASARATGGRSRRLVELFTQPAHVVDGYDDLDLHRLAHAGVDDGDRTIARRSRPGLRETERSRRADAG